MYINSKKEKGKNKKELFLFCDIETFENEVKKLFLNCLRQTINKIKI